MMNSGPWLVVGLGNPGPRYAGNRHNVGQMVLGELAVRGEKSGRNHRSLAVVAEARLGTLPGGGPGPKVVLAKPETWLNGSGRPVAAVASIVTIAPERRRHVDDACARPVVTAHVKAITATR